MYLLCSECSIKRSGMRHKYNVISKGHFLTLGIHKQLGCESPEESKSTLQTHMFASARTVCLMCPYSTLSPLGALIRVPGCRLKLKATLLL